MSDLTKLMGERIRSFRKEKNLSQEELAYRASIHPTYVGQLERGEKNATLDSMEKITTALEITLEELFKGVQPVTGEQDSFTLNKIINLISGRSVEDQKVILSLLESLMHWKDKVK